MAGFEGFLKDISKLRDFFVDRFWAGSPKDTGDRPDISAAEREPHDA
jgi:hypothetical protein